MAAASTLSSRYRISIPKSVRERMSLRPGQRIAFIARADGISMVAIPEREVLAGMARGANPECYREPGDGS